MAFLETETSELKKVLNDTLPKEIEKYYRYYHRNR